VLDFYRPEPALWRALFLGYLRLAGNVVGWLWHRDPVVYGYIAASIDRWVSARRFSAVLGGAGLAVERERRKLLGGIALHLARRLEVPAGEGARDTSA
jgi:demethylmenaquinone methyltransferase / 2-methoxy-6-polyprenyl-1,4-benzoquinol methylase